MKVDPASRRVASSDRVYTLGDAADFPIKQAFLALLQAGATADQTAADVLGRKPFHADFAWNVMELGLKAMSHAMAN